ncbi:MAG: hypothetical protein DRH93_22095 [Deltaproteobacteria bacterium]|nr:MAG: hypothetical protein DRH93_22095 [Deltaproteobacteria bacterium]
MCGPLPEDLENCIALGWRSETILIIPELAFVELAQVLWKKEKAGFLESFEVDEILSSILELPLEVDGHYAILPDALEIARQYNITVYDAIFLAVAKKRNAQLITADQKIAKVFSDF